MKNKGLIHIYCGYGKGKTTAALGLAVRAAGSGMKVRIVQLLKGNPTSELAGLALIPNISVSRPPKNYGFISKMSDSDKSELKAVHDRLLSEAFEEMKSESIDMLIVDEFFAAYNNRLISEDIAKAVVFSKSDSCELILTGRDPSDEFIGAADYVSEIECVKHPYKNGIKARKGIEF